MSLYEVLKASKTERFPDYWTLLWGRKLSASMIKTITGVLPLTFTAKGGTAVDWVIYGNDENGTENLLNINDTWITAGQTTYSVDGQTLTVTGNWCLYIIIPVERNTNYYLDFNTVSSTAVQGAAVLGVLDGVLNNTDVVVNRQGVPFIFTTGEREQIAVVFYSGVNTVGTSVYDNIMLVKGSTAPDHYIPYQQGVGERTENLYDGTIVQGVWSSLTGQVPRMLSSSTRLATSTMLALDATETYNIKVFSATSDTLVVAIKLLNSAKEQIDDTGWAGISTSISGADYIVVNIRKFDESVITPADAAGITITKGSTAPAEYIPYGYQIPLTVSRQGQPDKTVDIYIGDTPLTEGQQVSKTSIGQDIELFEGENVVSTTLYNKPTMEIKYK